MTAIEYRNLVGKPLTEQEKRVVRFAADGLTNRQIGAQLFLAENTIKTMMARIMAKTGTTRRLQLVAIADEKVKFKTAPELIDLISAMRADRAAPSHSLGTPNWYRQEGELRLLDALIEQLAPLPVSAQTTAS